MVKDEMVGWWYQLDGHESEQTPGDSEGQGSFACCSPCGLKESNMTERLINCTLKMANMLNLLTMFKSRIFLKERTDMCYHLNES